MTSATTNLPPLIASRYVPVRLIAKGGMGAVYEVEHARTGEHLALKVLLSSVGPSAEALERFKREARASAQIKSEHVVRVTDADVAPELDGAPFLVMELLEGADLERQAGSTPVAPATVVEWLRQVARALDKAHRLGIVHRDLKPENIFLAKVEDRAPIVKLLDFGIVKMAEDEARATGSGQIVGTPRYLAPEQASKERRVTPATDRYALGLVAYRLLSGESYYRGNVLSILAQLLHDPLELPSQRHPALGAAFDRWFLQACHREAESRFTTASEQIEALAAVFGLPALAGHGAEEATVTTPRSRSRRRAATLTLAGAGLLGATLAGIFLSQRSSPGRASATPATFVTSEAPAVAPPAPSPAPSVPAPPIEAAGSDPSQASSKRTRGKARPAPPRAPAPDPYADQK